MPTILIVDDSDLYSEMLSFSFQEAGFDVFSAGDGAEALALAKKTDVDFILSDLKMPIMDGYTLLKKLRCIERFKQLPIVILTGESTVETKAKGYEAGVTGWIEKPIDMGTLIMTVGQLISKPSITL